MPDEGGLDGRGGNGFGALNRTLLSATCNMASGDVVLMPTLPICANDFSHKTMNKKLMKIIFFTCFYVWGISG
jgi:hypothetical protein